MRTKIIYFLLILSISFSNFFYVQGAELNWNSETPLPALRSYNSAIAHEDSVYVFSGFNPDFYPYNDPNTYIYNIHTQMWSVGEACPDGKLNYGFARVGSKVYLFGGNTYKTHPTGQSLKTINTLNIYDLNSNTWSEGPVLPINMGHSNYTKAAAVGTDIYVYVEMNDLRIFNTMTNLWEETIVPFPEAKGWTAYMHAIGNKLYFNFMDDPTLIIYDIENDTWSKGASMPQPISGAPDSIVIDNKIYVVGNMIKNKEYNRFECSGDIYIYDSMTDSWDTIATLEGRSASSIAYNSGRLYNISGLYGFNRKLTNTALSLPLYPTWIELNTIETSIEPGQGFELKASLLPANSIYKQRISFSSSDDAIALVDEAGFVSAIQEGNVIITARTPQGIIAECHVTVAGYRKVEGISLTPNYASAHIGETFIITSKITPENATNPAVTWYSSNPAVATVNAMGEVTTHSKGFVTIIAQTQDSSLLAFCNLDVID